MKNFTWKGKCNVPDWKKQNLRLKQLLMEIELKNYILFATRY